MLLLFAVSNSFNSTTSVRADDWPTRGQTIFRQSCVEKGMGPHFWQPFPTEVRATGAGTDRIPVTRIGRLKWTAGGFHQSMCDPVVSDDLVWIGTADPIGEDETDSGVLACLDATSGKLLFQHVSRKLDVSQQDWPGTGNTSSPFIRGNRLWFCTTRLEVVCLDIQPLIERSGQPKVIWTADLKSRFKVIPTDVHLGNRASRCSIVGIDGRIFVNTTTSSDFRNKPTVGATAPSFVCLDQETGETLWTDSSPGNRIARNQHCNPVIFRKGNKHYVAIGQGDGYVRAFECDSGKVVWQFDLSTQKQRREIGKNDYHRFRLITESPAFDGRYLYFVIGTDREGTYGPGGIFCIDPFGSGDVSRDIDQNGTSLPNANSKLVWEHSGTPAEPFAPSIAGVCVTPRLLISADMDGSVRCFDKFTGRLYWRHLMDGNVIGTPLVVGDTLYVTNDMGEVVVLRASETFELIATIEHEQPIESSPIYANETLYIVTRQKVFAVGK